jgi:hypothetical protein
LKQFHDAAWNGYITHCRAYDDVLPLLADQYARAIARLTDSPVEPGPSEANEEPLVEHLMIFYLRGLLALEDPLLHRFFEIAPERLRGHALAFVGRDLKEHSELDRQVIERAKLLWDARAGVARVSPEEHGDELEAFGWWFSSKKFEVEWSMYRLRQALELRKRTDADHLVLRALAEVPEELLLAAVECSTLLMEGVSDTWTLRGWEGDLRAILRKALAGPTAASSATEFINRLAAYGYLEFRELLVEG